MRTQLDRDGGGNTLPQIGSTLYGKTSTSRALVRPDTSYVSNMDEGDYGIQIGRVDFRNDDRIFGIKDEDRFLHVPECGRKRQAIR